MATATKKAPAKLSRPATEPTALPASSEAKLRRSPAKKVPAAKTAATKKAPAAKPARTANGTNAHPQFDQFLAEVLTNPEARGAFEDATARASLLDALTALHNERGMTQGQLGKVAGINQATISHLLAGNVMPLHAVQKVARALGAKLEIRLVR